MCSFDHNNNNNIPHLTCVALFMVPYVATMLFTLMYFKAFISENNHLEAFGHYFFSFFFLVNGKRMNIIDLTSRDLEHTHKMITPKSGCI